jgi:hypothetical protein
MTAVEGVAVSQVERLEPCPFCGGEVELMHDHTTEQVDYIKHRTFDPDCLNPNVSAFSCGNEQLVRRWNTRTSSTAELLETLSISTAFLELEAEHHRTNGDKGKADSCAGQAASNRALIAKATGSDPLNSMNREEGE